jgi:Uncharacterized conserved protein
MHSEGFGRRCLVVAVFLVLFFGFYERAEAQKVRLRGIVTPVCGGSSRSKFADIYADGNIAVQGSYDCRGAFIYDVSNPDEPRLASWYNPGNNQQFLEAIVVGNRAYFGSGNGGGVHIVDVSNPSNPQLLGVVNSSNANAFNSIHEMMVFEQNGQTYLIENYNSTVVTKNLKVINVTNPASPVYVRDITPTEPLWVHAMHIRGNRMFTSGWGNGSAARGRTEIYDISNIETQPPQLLGYIEDPNPNPNAGNRMHSSWTSEDGNYLYSCRELLDGDLRVYDIRDPAQPLLVKTIKAADLNLNAITPHNPVVMGNLLYVSWYQAGLQIFDISNPADPKRIGQYDTYYTAFAPTEEEKQALLNSDPWDIVCGASNLQNVLPTTYDGNWAVYPFLGQDKVLAGDMTHGLLVLDASKIDLPLKNRVSDFDGDGKTDFSVFTPETGNWTFERSSGGATETVQFGASGDKIQAADFDGDGRTDPAVFRPSDGTWYVLGSERGFFAVQFGTNGDIPVAADYDADGKADFAVYRPSIGTWFIQNSILGFRAVQWGLSGDKPVTGDFEGDGKADFAVWRPSNGTWYILQSSSSLPIITQFGASGDKPLSGDFDGDGVFDLAVFRPSIGTWYILGSRDASFFAYQFGLAADMPVPADYDGDGRADIAVFRAANNAWYRLNSSDGQFSAKTFGQPGDIPSPVSVQP